MIILRLNEKIIAVIVVLSIPTLFVMFGNFQTTAKPIDENKTPLLKLQNDGGLSEYSFSA
jgi:hypothetical protein